MANPSATIETTASKSLAGQIPIGPRSADQRMQVVLGAGAAGGLCRDLLRQHVQRRVMGHDAVEVTAARRTQERRALHQVVQRHRQHSPFWRAADRVSRSTDALEQRRDAMRRSDLTHEIDMTDVDAELE